MNDFDEPQRLFESGDAPPRLRSLLTRAHEDVPSPAEQQLLVKAALAKGTAGWGPLAGQAGGVRWAARLARHSTKLLSMAAVVSVGAGALYVSGVRDRQMARPEERPAAPISAAPVLDENQAPALAPEPGEAPAGVGDPSGSGTIAPEPAPTAVRPVTAPARSAMRSHARKVGTSAKGAFDGRTGARAPASVGTAAPAAATEAPAATPAPVEEPRAPEAPPPAREDNPAEALAPIAAARVEPAPTPMAKVDGRDAASGSEEATLLRSARQALARSPERTLALTEEHLRRFPRGILDQEREALAIEALVKLGRFNRARSRAHAFERDYRDSPYRARIERALTPVPGGLAPP